eukprot:5182345-Pleurochrysis_carterae.AAC.1
MAVAGGRWHWLPAACGAPRRWSARRGRRSAPESAARASRPREQASQPNPTETARRRGRRGAVNVAARIRGLMKCEASRAIGSVRTSAAARIVGKS